MNDKSTYFKIPEDIFSAMGEEDAMKTPYYSMHRSSVKDKNGKYWYALVIFKVREDLDQNYTSSINLEGEEILKGIFVKLNTDRKFLVFINRNGGEITLGYNKDLLDNLIKDGILVHMPEHEVTSYEFGLL